MALSSTAAQLAGGSDFLSPTYVQPTATPSAQLKGSYGPGYVAPAPSGGAYQPIASGYTPSGGSYGGSVLGTSTKATTPTTTNTTVPSTTPPLKQLTNADIDAVYNPLYGDITNNLNYLGTQQNNMQGTLDKSYQSQVGLIDPQQQQLYGQLDTSKSQWNNQLQGAYADALRSYQALQQQNSAMYGGQSSAAGAVNDILNQEYLRQQGGMAGQNETAQQQFGNQKGAIDLWAVQQKSQLDNWHNEATTQLASEFGQGITAINNQKGILDSQKQAAKNDLLNKTFQEQQAINDFKARLQAQVDLMGPNYAAAPGIYAAAQSAPVMSAFDNSGASNIVGANTQALQSYQMPTINYQAPVAHSVYTPSVPAQNGQNTFASLNPFGSTDVTQATA